MTAPVPVRSAPSTSTLTEVSQPPQMTLTIKTGMVNTRPKIRASFPLSMTALGVWTMNLRSSTSSAPGLHGPVHLPFGVPPGGGLPLIIELLALGQADLQLDPGPLEVDGQRDEGIAVLLDPAEEPHDLPLVHQQPAGAAGVLVEDVPLLIGADMHPKDRYLPILDQAEGVLQVHIAQTDGFDLCARQLDPSLIPLLDGIVVECLVVFGDDLHPIAHSGHLALLGQSSNYITGWAKRQEESVGPPRPKLPEISADGLPRPLRRPPWDRDIRQISHPSLGAIGEYGKNAGNELRSSLHCGKLSKNIWGGEQDDPKVGHNDP